MMTFNESTKLIFRSLRRFISLSFILGFMILMVRLYELIITSIFSNYPPGSFTAMLTGIRFDVILYLQISAVLLVPFLLIAFFSQKVALYFFASASTLLILGNMLLLEYFATARVPLGADLLGYSLAEIRNTVGASGELRILPFLTMALFLIYMFRVIVKHVYFKLKPWLVVTLTVLMLGSWLPIRLLTPNPSKYDNEFDLFAADNKLGFFGRSMLTHYWNKGSGEIKPYKFPARTSSSAEGNPFTYIAQDYPFLHNETTPNMLGEYFNFKSSRPNIVFIFVESLGRAYSGENAYLGSFTPFLDSLMQKSLYWENCLSTSGRTFQVLPSALASLPFGDHGFSELKDQMPEHVSLLSLLKKQAGYHSSFIYGGEASFDQMDAFLNRQRIDQIIDSQNFGPGYEKLPPKANAFSWGYGDREIFRKYLEEIHAKSDTPRIDVMLTLATHDPFLLPNQDYYNSKFEERLKSLRLNDKTTNFDLQFSKELTTLLYFDESLRYFFREISKTTEFANTIFIITGDHRMPEIPISTQIDRFHVPLVIYSPMLKKPQKFSSVVTHFDLTPSLVAMLNELKTVKRPSVAAWIGHGLDNSTDFRSLQTYPLMRNKNEILDLLSSEQFLSGQTAYQISPNLNIESLDDNQLAAELKNELDNFILRNNFACKNNKLIPDSLSVYYK